MDIRILTELRRMKKLMNYNDNDNSLIFEQDTAYDRYLDRKAKEETERYARKKDSPNSFEDWKSIEIGEGTKYPVMLAGYKVPIVYNPVTNQLPIKQFKGESDFEKFFADSGMNVMSFVDGDKLDNGSEAPIGRKYATKDNKKYCLPDENWTKLHTDKGYVYAFDNPKTLKSYSVVLRLSPSLIVNGKTISGEEASRQCVAGAAGWEFYLTLNPPQVFFYKPATSGEKGKLRPYDPNEDANPNSEFDDWWDSGWGIAIELTIGIAAGFLTAGAATALLAAARAGSLGLRLGSLVIALGETAYFGGSTSILTPIVGSLIEAGLMALPTYYNYERGNYDDAILGLVFSFLPFFTELPAVSRLFKTGKVSRSASEKLGKEIVAKMGEAGGYKAIAQSETATANFLATLTPESQAIFLKTMEDISKQANAPVLEKGIKLVLKQNSDVIVEQLAKKPDTTIGKVANTVLQNVNVVTGKGLIPQFIRAGVPIFGMTISFLKGYNHLVNQGVSPESAEKITKQMQDAISKNEYFNSLAKLQIDLGLGPQMVQQQIDDVFISTIDNNPDMINQVIESNTVQENLIQPKLESETEKQKVIMTDIVQNVVADLGSSLVVRLAKRQTLRDISKVTTLTEPETLSLLISKLGVEVESWTDTASETKWTFQTKNKENGEIEFSTDGNTKIKINGNEVNV